MDREPGSAGGRGSEAGSARSTAPGTDEKVIFEKAHVINCSMFVAASDVDNVTLEALMTCGDDFYMRSTYDLNAIKSLTQLLGLVDLQPKFDEHGNMTSMVEIGTNHFHLSKVLVGMAGCMLKHSYLVLVDDNGLVWVWYFLDQRLYEYKVDFIKIMDKPLRPEILENGIEVTTDTNTGCNTG